MLLLVSVVSVIGAAVVGIAFTRGLVNARGAEPADLHHPAFDVDERCIPAGVQVLAELGLGAAAAGTGDTVLTGRWDEQESRR